MNAEAKIPFLPGEKIRCVSIPDHYAPLRYGLTGWVKEGHVYHVRAYHVDRYTGAVRVCLTGIHGVNDDDGRELGFPASMFIKVGGKPAALMPSEGDRFHVPVRFPQAMETPLESIPLSPLVEEFFRVEPDKLEVMCRRWKSHWRVSQPLEEMHREIAAAVESGPYVTIDIPLTGLGLQDLAEICGTLGIETEAWLQGVVGNLARRFERMRGAYESKVRNEPKRLAKEKQHQEWLERERRRKGMQ